MRKRRRWCPSPRLHHDGLPTWPSGRIIKIILIYTAICSLLLRSLPQYTLSLTTVFLLTATYIPLRIMCPSQPLPLLVSLLLFGATQHGILNPTTLTGAILTLYNYPPALQQKLYPISIALNICTEDPIVLIAITGFQNWMPVSIPTLNSGPRTRLILFMLILLLLITPVEVISSLQDAKILSKAATLLSTL